MKFDVMDARYMMYDNETFDLIIDKSTFDAIKQLHGKEILD